MIVSGVPALPYDDSAGFTAPPAFGPFRVLHQIGSGALGPVFRAFEPQQERLIAIKAFRLDVVPEVAARLSTALRRLVETRADSPRIVRVVDAGLEGMTPFLASEYVAAETLDVLMRRLAPAPLERALPILHEVSLAIADAWSQGFGHGALHPRDVFANPETQEVRVAGFGVASALESVGVKLRPRRPYTAPERSAGTEWDIRADVYSLGVLAHELLTGRRPSGAGEQDGALPVKTPPEARVAIRRALAGALADDPRRRYASPGEFISALETGASPVGVSDEAPRHAEVASALPLFDEPAPAVEVETAPPPDVGGTPAIVDVPPVDESVPLLSEPSRVPPRADRMVRVDELRRPVDDAPAPPVVLLPAHDSPSSWAAWPLLVVGALIGVGVTTWWTGRDRRADLRPTVDVAAGATAGTEVPVADPPAPSPSPTATLTDHPVEVEAPPTRGRLLVRSVPAGARVTISGRARGTTPAAVRDLPFGTYNVTVSRDGYQTRVQRVTLSREVPARDVTLELARASGRSMDAAAATGALYIDTRPTGAQVTLDGRVLGVTPMRVPEVSPGSHTIRLDLAGHKSVTTTVVVRAGQLVPVRVSLEVM